MERALNSIESQTINGLSTVLGKAGQLTTFAGYVGKADWFQNDLDRYRKVTAADVTRVANKYLGPNRLVMSYVPRTGEAPRANRGAADRPTSVKTDKKDDSRVAEQAARLPKPGPNPKFTLPAIHKTKLSNGLDVWMVSQDELPVVSMNLVLRTGSSNEPDDKIGVAGMTAQLLDDGTTTRSAADIVNQQQALGMNIGSGSGWDSTNVTLQTLSRNLDQALELYADVLQNPTFPANEVESLKGRSLIGLRQQKSNPNAMANVVYKQMLYGSHADGRDKRDSTIKANTPNKLDKYYGST